MIAKQVAFFSRFFFRWLTKFNSLDRWYLRGFSGRNDGICLFFLWQIGKIHMFFSIDWLIGVVFLSFFFNDGFPKITVFFTPDDKFAVIFRERLINCMVFLLVIGKFCRIFHCKIFINFMINQKKFWLFS